MKKNMFSQRYRNPETFTPIDLHTHSTASDGSLNPGELVRYAKARGLKAIALTDHDTITGIAGATKTANEVNMELIPGIEISARWELGTMHILGYYIDWKNSSLIYTLKNLQYARKERNLRLIKKLNKLGMNITYEEVKKIAHGQMGRLHISRILVKKGYASTINSAFKNYLVKGSPAYVPKLRLEPEKAMALIREAKGIPVLAHPYTLGLSNAAATEKLLLHLRDAGLEGIEIFYPEHSKEFESFCIAMAGKLNLIGTGGSDFHGENKEDIEIGIGRGNLRLDYSMLLELKDRKKQIDRGKLR